MQNFIEPPPRGGGGVGRQGAGCEKSQLGDFTVGYHRPPGRKIRHHIDCDMIAPGQIQVEEQPVQAGAPEQGDRGFLGQFACQRIFGGLADLHAAAGQLPARRVGMTQQQNLACRVYDDGPHAERHAASQPRP